MPEPTEPFPPTEPLNVVIKVCMSAIIRSARALTLIVLERGTPEQAAAVRVFANAIRENVLTFAESAGVPNARAEFERFREKRERAQSAPNN